MTDARRHVRYEAAGVVLTRADGCVLVLVRGDEVRLPKGHIEPGENAATAAVRELAEESGYCDVELRQPLGTARVEFDHDSPTEGPMHVTRLETYFAATLQSDRVVERPATDQAFTPMWMEQQAALRALTFREERQWLNGSIDAQRRGEPPDAADRA